MRKLFLPVVALLCLSQASKAQTVFSFGNNSVAKQDFLRNYQKNTINKKPDMSEKALREYLKLYSLFRMKVKEAVRKKVKMNRYVAWGL